MRDEYYDDQEDISIDDIEDGWLDEEDDYGEPAPAAPVRRAQEPRSRRILRRQDRKAARRGESAAPVRRASGIAGRGDAASADDARSGSRTGNARSNSASPVNDLLLLLFKIGLVAAFLIFMTTFFYGITQARDTSMEPAVKEGDLVIYYRPDKSYAVGDAIVVDYNGELQVRRVVATEGDTVDISADGGLIVNGSTQIEDDIYTTTYPYTDGITFPVTVGSGEVFVLGDDRTNAEDSRVYGTVRIKATKGAVMTVIRRRGI